MPDGAACAGRILAERDGMFRRNRWYNPRSVGDDPICPRVYNMHERTVRQRMMVNAIGGTDCTGAHLLGQPGRAGYTKTSLVYVEECFGRHASGLVAGRGPAVPVAARGLPVPRGDLEDLKDVLRAERSGREAPGLD
jgi:hypothetical protein